MSWKDTLKKARLIEEVDESDSTANTPPVTPSKPATPFQFTSGAGTTAFQATTPNINPFAPAASTIDPAIVETLRKALADAKNGAYKAFRVVLDSLPIPDETTRYRTALDILAKSQNISSDQVLAALDEEGNILGTQHTAFDSFVQSSIDSDVTAKNEQAKDAAAQIAALQQQIADLTQKGQTLVAEATAAQNNINAQKATFEASFASVQAEVQTERSKIAMFVTPTIQSK